MFRSISVFLLLVLCTGCSRSTVYEDYSPIIQPAPFLIPEYMPAPEARSSYTQPETKQSVQLPPLIVIDPGHGGKDQGTQSKGEPKYEEKHLNLSTAKMVGQFLQKMGYRTAFTRKDDIFISLDKRASYANHLCPTLFVSVHYNSAPSEQAHGIEVFFYQSDTDKQRSEASRNLAQAILNQVITSTKAKSRGVKHGNLAVIRETNVPAILIEGGFLTNPAERQKLLDSSYQKKIALGIAKGVDKYLRDLQN